jgi:hypothetical protein
MVNTFKARASQEKSALENGWLDHQGCVGLRWLDGRARLVFLRDWLFNPGFMNRILRFLSSNSTSIIHALWRQ